MKVVLRKQVTLERQPGVLRKNLPPVFMGSAGACLKVILGTALGRVMLRETLRLCGSPSQYFRLGIILH